MAATERTAMSHHRLSRRCVLLESDGASSLVGKRLKSLEVVSCSGATPALHRRKSGLPKARDILEQQSPQKTTCSLSYASTCKFFEFKLNVLKSFFFEISKSLIEGTKCLKL